MGNFLETMGKRVAMTVVGVVLCLAYWTFTGSGQGNYENLDTLPEFVFDGGGGILTLDVEVNQPAVLRATFARYGEDENEEEEGIQVHQEIGSGKHQFRTDVADDTYCYVEIGVPDATVGARINWTAALDGKTVFRGSETLDEPLRRGYAFFVQLEYDDVQQMRESIGRRR